MRFWAKLGLSVFAIFALLHGSATALGSVRGEAGIRVAAVTLLACLVAERLLWGMPVSAGYRALGLGLPTGRSLVVACGIGGLLLLVLPLFATVTRAQAAMYPGWLSLVPGLFAQGGVAEEALFRGYLFGTLRRHHSFGRAALLSTGPFLAVHLLLFGTMSWPVALAATALSLISSFPLAHLFEVGARTIWPAALVHFFMQAPIKVVEMSGPSVAMYPIAWMAACAAIPWLAFCAPRMPAVPPVGLRAEPVM